MPHRDGGAREIRGAPQEAEVQLFRILLDGGLLDGGLLDGGQIESGAMGRPGFGGLREGLERVLRADSVEVIEAQVEKAR